MAMEAQTHQYILAIYSVLEMRVKYISVWEMNNQLIVHMIMMYQWNVYVSEVYVNLILNQAVMLFRVFVYIRT